VDDFCSLPVAPVVVAVVVEAEVTLEETEGSVSSTAHTKKRIRQRH
jgi:hypothetical protein